MNNTKLTPVVLFRSDKDSLEELEICKEYFPVYQYRSEIPQNSLVICRYSALPFYKELEVDVNNLGSKLITSFTEFNWVADFHYYHILKDYTPKTWLEHELPYMDYKGPLVVKGVTNSRKHQWKTHMYAENRSQALEVANKLMNDPLIGRQGLIYRQFVHLKVLEYDDIYGLPYANEWRFFYYKDQLLSHGFYWTNCDDPSKASIDIAGYSFAQKVADIASKYTPFFVLDIAEKEDGGWTLIEMNSGQMSGLSFNDAHKLYGNLKKQLYESD